MTASWAAVVVAAIAVVTTMVTMLVRGGRRDGKIDAILTYLTELGAAHETRIRDLEINAGRHRRR